MQAKQSEICPFCKRSNSLRTDSARGEIVCQECHMVVEDRLIDQTSEWRNFSSELSSHASDPNRVGGPADEYMEDGGMNLKLVDGNSRRPLAKIAQRSGQEAGDKRLSQGFGEIKDMSESLSLSGDIQNRSKELFAKIAKKEKLKGRNMKAVVAAVIYVAAKECKNPRNMKKIIQIAGQKKKEILRCVKLVRSVIQPTKQTQSLHEMATHLCNRLKLGQKILFDASETVGNIDKGGYLGGRNPYTKTGVAIFLVSRKAPKEPTLEEIAEGAMTTPATLRTSIKQLKPHILQVVPEAHRSSPELLALIEKY